MLKNRLLNWVLIISLLVQSAIFGMLFGRIKAEAHSGAGISCNGLRLKNCEAGGAYVTSNLSACDCGYDTPKVQSADAMNMYHAAYFMSVCDNSWP